MANQESIGNVTAKCIGSSNKDVFRSELFVNIIGNKAMYKTGTNGYVIVPANMTYKTGVHSKSFNAKFIDHDGDEFFLNVPYWT